MKNDKYKDFDNSSNRENGSNNENNLIHMVLVAFFKYSELNKIHTSY